MPAYPTSYERVIYNKDESYIIMFNRYDSSQHPVFYNIESMEVIDYR